MKLLSKPVLRNGSLPLKTEALLRYLLIDSKRFEMHSTLG